MPPSIPPRGNTPSHALILGTMRIFLAGASGVIGAQLVPMLVAAGHEVAGMTRSPEKAAALAQLGAEPVVCDVYDLAALRDAVVSFGPQVIMHQLTDLPDDESRVSPLADRNDRMRTEGTRNLIAAAQAAGADRLLAQSIAWQLPGGRGATIAAHEAAVLDAGGVVLRYGRFYGPATYYETAPPPPPRIAVAEAARRTAELLYAAPGIVEVVESRGTG
jgi:nucleoside-diphosphate-sugar epimerase